MSVLRIALIISVGFNLFVAGWWVGDIWHRPPMMGMPAPNISFLENLVKDRVSPETIEAIGPSLELIDATFRAGFDARTAIFADLRVAVSAEPYDPAAVSELFSVLVNSRTQTETEQWRQIGETLGQLPADQRSILADIFFPAPADARFLPGLPPGAP